MQALAKITLFMTAALLAAACDDAPRPAPADTTPDAASDADADAASDATDDGDATDLVEADAPPLDLEILPEDTLYDVANACVAVALDRGDGEAPRWLRANDQGDAFAFDADSDDAAAKLWLKPSDLGTYLLYDQRRGYVVAGGDGALLREERLRSDLDEVSDTFISGAEWRLEPSQRVSLRHQLRSRRDDALMAADGRPADLRLEPAQGCAAHPEMSLDAEGVVTKTRWEDGDLYGFVDAHSHILSNFGFGGGGIFHGAPFHRLGVEHALGSCAPFHGPDGRADFLSWGSNAAQDIRFEDLLTLLTTGLLPEPLHATDGWPTFSGWPAQRNDTHQTQYYRWLERAWMGGLRLIVQHAVSNEALCDVMVKTGFQPARWSCRDMVNIDRQLLEIRRMEDYIDAQAGGPGEGWFRVVESPQEAREVIGQGKLAVILGIEVPNLFDCYLTPRPDLPACDDAFIEAQLDRYYGLGVRVLFPNHKLDNAFTPGDGSKGIMELANFLQTGHWSDFVDDCPQVSTAFDKGAVVFGGFNMPREDYLSPAPNPLIELSMTPIVDLLPYADRLQEGGLDGDWCQQGDLTPRGRKLFQGIIARGMIPELDHLPRRAHQSAFALLKDADYPAAATHGNLNNGRFYELGGVAPADFRRCADPDEPGAVARPFRDRRDRRAEAGLYPAEGFAFDLNGLAGVPDPRFGPDAGCPAPQENPVAYPFTSFAGDVTFTQPVIGERPLDFNTEGMVHIGLVPELVQDARRAGATDEDLEILFRSAEGYLRTWERAQARAAALQPQP
jgi:hypothetical protein